MIDPTVVYEESSKVQAENTKFRGLLGKAADHIEALGDILTAAIIREAIK